MDPLLIGQRGPDVMWLGHDTLVWRQNNLSSLWVQMQGPQNQNEPTEACEAGLALLPVVIQVEE